MIDYNKFSSMLSNHIGKYDFDFVYDLLVTIVKNPTRYTGIFRVTNAKTKLIQNVTQSQEIKFGDFMENIITEYISKMGYINLPKNIGKDDEGNLLNADQVFTYNNSSIYLIEQKIRDDHDSTKKRGQYSNFQRKINCLKKQYPNKEIVAVMWFIDDTLTKNKNFYTQQIHSEKIDNVRIYIKYGKELFDDIFGKVCVWNEICEHLYKNKQERTRNIIDIPDFDTSNNVKQAILLLKEKEPTLYKKLMSNDPKYINLRQELFPSGNTLV